MTKGRKTTTIGLRLPDDFLAQVEPKAKTKGLTTTEYIRKFVFKELLRKHQKESANG